MYTAYFGLRENPFQITPNLRFLYSTPTYQEVYTRLLSGICEHKGLLMLTGEVGTGKTTLLRGLMTALEAPASLAFLYLTTLAFDDLLSFICEGFSLPERGEERQQKIQVLHEFLLAQWRASRLAVLLIDEAQNLEAEALEGLHLLLDLKLDGNPLLQIVLVGQPELEENLARPQFRHLKQRINIQLRLDCLKESEVGAFIYHRLQVAGSNRQDLFPPEVIQRIAQYSQGIPRLINLICDNALLIAYEDRQKTISFGIIEMIAADFLFNETPKVTKENGGNQTLLPSLSPPLFEGAEKVEVGLIPAKSSRTFSWRLLPGFALFLIVFGLLVYRMPGRLLLSPPFQSSETAQIAPPRTPKQESVGTVEQNRSAVHEDEPEEDSSPSAQTAERGAYVVALPEPVAAPVPPIIRRVHPSIAPDQEIVVTEGEQLAFSIEAESPQNSLLRYAWLFNGQRRGKGKTWTYRPDFNAGNTKLQEVKALVTDQNNFRVERTWKVRVTNVNRPPHIAAASPQGEAVEVSSGDKQNFFVRASDPDKDDSLAYTWFLDGQEITRGQQLGLHSPPTFSSPKLSQVKVEVTDKEGLKDQRVWDLIPRISLPPLQLSETEVQTWLTAYRHAWEEKNIDELVELGAISGQKEDEVRRILAQYQSLHVALQNVDIRSEGDRAIVTFSRVDTINGQTMAHPSRKVFTIEKATNGRLTARLQ